MQIRDFGSKLKNNKQSKKTIKNQKQIYPPIPNMGVSQKGGTQKWVVDKGNSHL